MLAKLVLSLIGACLLAAFQSAEAQQPAKVPKIGEILFRSRSDLGAGREAFQRALRALGYFEGKNISFETRSADGKADRFPALANELVGLGVATLFASSTNEAMAFKIATTTIPIVFAVSSDPVADGLVESLARPGGNITGFTSFTSVLAGKRLELLKETVPSLIHVAVLWNPQDPGSTQQWNENQMAARELGLQLQSIEISSADKIEGAFHEATKARSTALTVMAGSLATSNLKVIADLAIKHRLPAIFHRGNWVDSGGLMSYGPDPDERYSRVASMIDKILKGTKPADIPVEQLTKFEFVINLKTAKAIGVILPPEVLARANRIIR